VFGALLNENTDSIMRASENQKNGKRLRLVQMLYQDIKKLPSKKLGDSVKLASKPSE